MPINANYEYSNAEKYYYSCQTDEERLKALEEMIRTMPQHKGAESLRANLRTRYKKLKGKIETQKAKKKKSGFSFSIKKGDLQTVLIGLTGTGKSSILKALTNANPKIADYPFTTQTPEIGILNYQTCQIQIIDLPAVGSENFERGIINTADTALMIITEITQIAEIEKVLEKFHGKKIVVFNKSDLLTDTLKRKISETLKTKRYNFCLISSKTGEGLEDLKEKIFGSFSKIRIYTKQPGNSPDPYPIIMPPETIVEEIAKIIFRGNTSIIKKIRIWGPSSKFGGQETGLKHILKDKDIIEFSTR
jgi:ribosome-interacting GTPase 1